MGFLELEQFGKRMLERYPVIKCCAKRNRDTNIRFLSEDDVSLPSPAVSIVIPCYNAVKTLKRTLDSLSEQTFRNFEVILIDDGSTDGTDKLIEQLCGRYAFPMRCRHQENAGVSTARNSGIDLARGKYIAFLDADDTYHKSFLEMTVHACEQDGVDVVLSHQERDIAALHSAGAFSAFRIEKSDIASFAYYFMYNKENIHFGGFLYRRAFIDGLGLRFTPGVQYGEDLEFVWKYLTMCKVGIILPEKLYGYCDNPTSVLKNVRWEKTDTPQAMMRVYGMMKEVNCPFSEGFYSYFLPRTVWTAAKTFAVAGRRDLYRRFLKEYPVRQYMKSLVRFSRNWLLTASSALFCISPLAYYEAIRIVYKFR